jgi:hypothetical protein
MNTLELQKEYLRAVRVKARRSFEKFVLITKPDYKLNWHHKLLMQKLQAFALGHIKKLMVFMPPQHGKSELTSRRLPAYILGINPDAKIAGCSYAADLSKSFNRDVQRIIEDDVYGGIFPGTTLNSSNVKSSAKGSYLRNADIFEVVGHKGFYKSVGVGGSLTGTPVDIGLIDDPVKDVVEANSATYRARVWDWFTGVFLTRLHNDSQILITQTRWHEDDLSGRILKSKQAHEWEVLTLPGILETADKHEDDPRQIGEALWADRHSLKKLLDFKDASPRLFQAMYQQDPRPFEGGLVYPKWSSCSLQDYKMVRIEEINGLDFGYSTSPAAFIGVKIDTVAKRIYLRLKIYGKFIKLKQLAEQMTDKLDSSRQEIIADSADPLLIEHLKSQYKMNVHKAIKGKDSVSFGITLMNNFEIVVVDEGGEPLKRELKNYRYKEDADGNPLDEPVKEYDHALDAARYVVLKKLGRKGSKFTVF